MLQTPYQNRKRFKKVVLFASLFLGIFLVSFYFVNLDFSLNSNKPLTDKTLSSVNLQTELKKRIGSMEIALESYAAWGNRYGLTVKNSELDVDADKDEMPNYLEYVYGTNPLKVDSDGDKYSDRQEIINGYDPDASGDTKPFTFVTISKIKVEAPMIWSQSEVEKEVFNDLEKGLSHFPKSASPGQNGNMIISGHSSNYIWSKGSYNHVFKDLNNLEKGDLIYVKTIQRNGRIVVYHYKVKDKFITVPNDEEIFADTPVPSLTLSTCWPIGTNLKRVIVKAEMVK